MSIRVLHDTDTDQATLYCSVTERPVGRIFHGNNNGTLNAQEMAMAFLAKMAKQSRDVSKFHSDEIADLSDDFVAGWGEEDEYLRELIDHT